MSKSLSKKELVELLGAAKTSAERNKAVKLLKRFDPVPNYSYDHLANKNNMTIKELNYIAAYVCQRCGKVKQAKSKVFWLVPDSDAGSATAASSSTTGVESATNRSSTKKLVICVGCQSQILQMQETNKLRAQHQKAGLVPQGYGFGLSGDGLIKGGYAQK